MRSNITSECTVDTTLVGTVFQEIHRVYSNSEVLGFVKGIFLLQILGCYFCLIVLRLNTCCLGLIFVTIEAGEMCLAHIPHRVLKLSPKL
jgi:hypothetical protein